MKCRYVCGSFFFSEEKVELLGNIDARVEIVDRLIFEILEYRVESALAVLTTLIAVVAVACRWRRFDDEVGEQVEHKLNSRSHCTHFTIKAIVDADVDCVRIVAEEQEQPVLACDN